MPKTTLHLVRHAQGFHNLNTANHQLPDPSLTPLGETQCAALSASFPYHSKITHLVASPLRRTIYTTLLSFPDGVHREGLRILALPDLQETSDLPCDTGSESSALEREFNTLSTMVDLSQVHEGWNSKDGKWAAGAPLIEARAREARVFLRALGQEGEGEKHIVVVTHGGFLHYFTEDWDGHSLFEGTGWANTEWRSYQFVDEKGADVNAGLKETRESRERRRGKETPLTGDEQRELRASAEKGWGESGFQLLVQETGC